MHIRHLASEELGQLLALYQHLHPQDEPLPDTATVESIWHELMGNSRYQYLGAFQEERLIASCTLTLVPNLTHGCKPYGLIENVVTHSDYRQRGLGKKLLAHTLERAWEAGCYKVTLMTGRKDEATLGFYKAAGFDPNDKQAFVARPPHIAPSTTTA